MLVAVILTYNEAGHIRDCIESVRFADWVLVLDSYSTDGTPELARQAGAEVVQRPFADYADQRNYAIQIVANRAAWVLFVDADERIPPELAAEIQDAITQPGYAAWKLPRYNYIFGRLTWGGGWYPDYQTRLIRVGSARFDPARKVHEVVILDGPLGALKGHIVHYNYKDVPQFMLKQRRYAIYEARTLFDQGIRPRLRNFVLQPLRQFRWRFITLKGYRDGLHGLRLCALMGWYEFRKYVLLRELWEQKPG